MSPPVEYEMNYYRSQEGSLEMARLNQNSLRKTRDGSLPDQTANGASTPPV